MRSLLALCALLSISFAALPTSPLSRVKSGAGASAPDVFVEYATLNIDHFNANGHSETFKNRVLINAKHWDRENGPIFFYAGNEGEVWAFYNNSGFMTETLAKEFKALVVFAEHRYFGESMPFGKDSYEPKNLPFLSVEQVMADYVEIARQVRFYAEDETRPIVLFGGSYGGMLASWLRMKFPETFQGAIASSAPILYFKGKTEPNAFYRVVTDAYRKADQQCPAKVQKVQAMLMEHASEKSLYGLI